MNRRTFFRRAAAAAAAALALPFTSHRSSGPIPPFKRQGNQWVVNPEWENAPFEFSFYTASGIQVTDPWPRRFRSAADGCAWIVEQGKK